MKAVCVGHSTYDITLPLEDFPKENVKYRINKHIECGGGPASNGAYLLAKWGMNTSIVSIVGNDYYGQKVLESFKEIGADTTYLELRENHQTSSSYILANLKNGSRTIITSKRDPRDKVTAFSTLSLVRLTLLQMRQFPPPHSWFRSSARCSVEARKENMNRSTNKTAAFLCCPYLVISPRFPCTGICSILRIL